MVKIPDTLRKLGIFRAGKTSWSGEAKNRKIENIMDGVYDSKKDFIDNKNNGKSSFYLKLIIGLAALMGVFIVLMFAAAGSFGFWFVLNLLGWGGFIYYLVRSLKSKRYNLKKIIGLFSVVLVISLFTLAALPTTTKGLVDYKTSSNPTALVDMGIDLENTLKLEDVSVTEAAGGVIEIRTAAPTGVSSDTIMLTSAYIFSYVEPQLPDQIKSIRLILTVNGLDAIVIETSRENLKKYIAGDLSEKAYIATLTRNNLTK